MESLLKSYSFNLVTDSYSALYTYMYSYMYVCTYIAIIPIAMFKLFNFLLAVSTDEVEKSSKLQ